MAVGDARYDLLEELARLVLVELAVLDNVIEELAARHVLHHHENVTGRVDHLIELDDVRVAEELEILYLAAYLADHVERLDLVAVEYLDGDRVAGELMQRLLHLAEAARAQRLEQYVVAYLDLVVQRLRTHRRHRHRRGALAHLLLQLDHIRIGCHCARSLLLLYCLN